MSKNYLKKSVFQQTIKQLKDEISEIKKTNIENENKIKDLSKSINKNQKKNKENIRLYNRFIKSK